MYLPQDLPLFLIFFSYPARRKEIIESEFRNWKTDRSEHIFHSYPVILRSFFPLLSSSFPDASVLRCCNVSLFPLLLSFIRSRWRFSAANIPSVIFPVQPLTWKLKIKKKNKKINFFKRNQKRDDHVPWVKRFQDKDKVEISRLDSSRAVMRIISDSKGWACSMF